MPARSRGPAPGYRIEVFTEQDRVSAEEVVALWSGEAQVPPAEAERRVSELLLVATDERGSLAGVSTAYLDDNRQLRAAFWHFRVFVPRAHRQSNIAASLAVQARDHLVERFVRGEDRRGIGILYVIQSPVLKRHVSQATWPQTDFLFVGETPRGDHVRVYYFPGAQAPEPDQGRA